MSSRTNIKRKKIKINYWCSDRDEFLWNKEQRNERRRKEKNPKEPFLMLFSVDFVCWFRLSLSLHFSFSLCVWMCFILYFFSHRIAITYAICAVWPKIERHECSGYPGQNEYCLRQYNCGDSFGYIFSIYQTLSHHPVSIPSPSISLCLPRIFFPTSNIYGCCLLRWICKPKWVFFISAITFLPTMKTLMKLLHRYKMWKFQMIFIGHCLACLLSLLHWKWCLFMVVPFFSLVLRFFHHHFRMSNCGRLIGRRLL